MQVCFFIDSDVLVDQYIGDVSDYQTGQDLVVERITCPQNAVHIMECDYTIGSNGCFSHGNEAVLTCINSECLCTYIGDVHTSLIISIRRKYLHKWGYKITN